VKLDCVLNVAQRRIKGIPFPIITPWMPTGYATWSFLKNKPRSCFQERGLKGELKNLAATATEQQQRGCT